MKETRNWALAILFCLGGASCSNPPPSQEDVLIAGSAQALRHMMRNPDSFKIEKATQEPDGAICYTYRAQNGFGGMDKNNAVATLVESRFHVVVADEGEGLAAWLKHCSNTTDGKDVTSYAEYALTLPNLLGS